MPKTTLQKIRVRQRFKIFFLCCVCQYRRVCGWKLAVLPDNKNAYLFNGEGWQVLEKENTSVPRDQMEGCTNCYTIGWGGHYWRQPKTMSHGHQTCYVTFQGQGCWPDVLRNLFSDPDCTPHAFSVAHWSVCDVCAGLFKTWSFEVDRAPKRQEIRPQTFCTKAFDKHPECCIAKSILNAWVLFFKAQNPLSTHWSVVS